MVEREQTAQREANEEKGVDHGTRFRVGASM
jgi:hypothetical protein